jgi:hypothetical protein
MAVILRGYDRSTRDVDAVVLDADDCISDILSTLREHGVELRIPDGLEFARKNRVLLLRMSDGTEADLSLGFLPFERELVERATFEPISPQVAAPVASAEDLVIMKLIALRDRDRDDIRRLYELYPDIDVVRIRRIVSEFAELLEQPEIVHFMNSLLA